MEEAMVDYERSGLAARAERPAGPISQGMATLNETIERASALVRALEERIDAVLAPSPPSPDVALIAVQGDSTVAGFFRTQVREVEELCERLDRIRARVEL